MATSADHHFRPGDQIAHLLVATFNGLLPARRQVGRGGPGNGEAGVALKGFGFQNDSVVFALRRRLRAGLGDRRLDWVVR